MLINLFSDDSVSKKADRRFSLLNNTKFYLAEGYKDEFIIHSANNTCDDVFISSVKYALSNNRSTSIIFGANIDSHFNLESMNVSRRSKGFVVVYSINNLLPVILNILCGSDIKTVSNISEMNKISDSILNLNFSNDACVNDLINKDKNLDDYLKNRLMKDSNKVDNLRYLVSEINSIALIVLKYIMSYLETNSDLIVLSIDKSRILLSSDNECPPVIELKFNGNVYRLNPYVTDELNAFHRDNSNFNFCEVVC